MVDPEFGDTRLVGTSHAVTQNSSEYNFLVDLV